MQSNIDEQENELQVIAFEFIVNSGDARSQIHQSFAAMKKGEFDKATESLKGAEQSLLNAHRTQTKLLQENAQGKVLNLDILMIHAQDHLMTTILLQEIAQEMLELYQRIDS